MKEFITKNWFKIFLILIIVIAFYWFEWRPTQIRKECYQNALSWAVTTGLREEPDTLKRTELENKLINGSYNNCLRDKGLKN